MNTSAGLEQTAPPARSSKAALLKQARQLHLYLGVFFAPAILFFSLTGALQLFGLHESHPGDAYQAPKWISALASIHKDQVLSRHQGPPPAADRDRDRLPQHPQEPPRGREEHQESKVTLILKWFFLAMSLGLITTTLLGIYMAFKYNRSRVTVWSLLIAGAVIPGSLIAALA